MMLPLLSTFTTLFFLNTAAMSTIDIHWVIQGRDIEFQGFFVEFLGFASALRHRFPLLSLSKSFFYNSLEEDLSVDKVKFFDADLLPTEREIIHSLVDWNLSSPITNDIILPTSWSTSAHVNDAVIDSSSVCLTPIVQSGVTASGKELSKYLLTFNQSIDDNHNITSLCCQACSSHPYCLSWILDVLTKTCRLHRDHYSDKELKPDPNSFYGTISKQLRSLKPRALILHGTTCAFKNKTISFQRDIDTIVIGRFMVERAQFLHGMTSDEFAVSYCTSVVDELWVPTEWHRKVFEQLARKHGSAVPFITVIPEVVDTALFDPTFYLPVKLPASSVIATADGVGMNRLGSNDLSVIVKNKACHILDNQHVQCEGGLDHRYEFLSIFKWEHRKGWDVLLLAYWTAFTAQDHVVLRLKTYIPVADQDQTPVLHRLAEFARLHFNQELSSLAAVELVEGKGALRSDALTRTDIRDLYARADCFVLPTRGEGWGLPIAEAMAMALPVIVSNAPGPKAYITQENAYIIPVEEALDRLGFVQPKADVLTLLFRQVIRDSTVESNYLAQQKGWQGRLTMQNLTADSIVELMDGRLKFHAARRG